MALLSQITYDDILNEMMEKYAQESGFTPDDASDVAIRMKVLATQIHSSLSTGKWLLSQMFFDTASGEYLDMHAARQGITRNKGTKAVGSLKFTLKYALSYRLTIPKGLVCVCADEPSLRFVVTRDGYINAGDLSISVDAEAEEAGLAGNASAGSINLIIASPAADLSVQNTGTFRYGSDDESDEMLRKRISDACCYPSNGSNSAYYKSVALRVDTVRSVSVIPRVRGRGTVDVYVAETGKTADSETLSAVSSIMAAEREIGVDVAVMAATAKVISPTIKLKLENSSDFQNAKEQTAKIVQDFFNNMSIGETFRYNRLGNRLLEEIEGLIDYSFDSTALNVAVTNKEIPVLGTLTITNWS